MDFDTDIFTFRKSTFDPASDCLVSAEEDIISLEENLQEPEFAEYIGVLLGFNHIVWN
jgi:hypothetical protein